MGDESKHTGTRERPVILDEGDLDPLLGCVSTIGCGWGLGAWWPYGSVSATMAPTLGLRCFHSTTVEWHSTVSGESRVTSTIVQRWFLSCTLGTCSCQVPVSSVSQKKSAVSVFVGFIMPFVVVVWCSFLGLLIKAQSAFGVVVLHLCLIWLGLIRFHSHLFFMVRLIILEETSDKRTSLTT